MLFLFVIFWIVNENLSYIDGFVFVRGFGMIYH